MNKLTTVEIIARFNEQCFADNHFTDAQLLLEGSIYKKKICFSIVMKPAFLEKINRINKESPVIFSLRY